MDHRKHSCIFHCNVLGISLHSFPNPVKKPDMFSKWISVVGHQMTEKDPIKIYKNKRICSHHFEASQITAGHRLVHSALPSINLKCIQKSISSIVKEEHNYFCPRGVFAVGNNTESAAATSSVSAMVPEEVSAEVHVPMEVTMEANVIPIYPSAEIGVAQTVSKASLAPIEEPKSSNATDEQIRPVHSKPCQLHKKTNLRSMHLKSNKLPGLVKKQIKYLRNETHRLRANIKKLKIQKNVSNSEMLKKLTSEMSVSAQLLTRMQVQESRKASKGRRFTVNEKILALSIYKRSPKCYRFLHRLLTLPSPMILKRVLSKIQLGVGINVTILEHLKRTVSNLKLEDRLVTLMFDEMSLTPQINYNIYRDEFIGFEDFGNKRTTQFANKALVFMIKGIVANYKQPIAYYFTNNIKSYELKKLIVDVVTNVFYAGFVVVATVCDQCTLNVSAVNSLIHETKQKYLRADKEWRNDFFEINSKKIIHLYDVPHLIKGLRNNLLNKDLVYCTEKREEKKVKWDYLKKIVHADKNRGELKLLHKITNEHIDPKSMKKMKVKTAAQVLSHSMAVATDLLVSRGDVPQECGDMIPFLLYIDKLFDSLNSSTFHVPDGKIYKGPVRRNSVHHQLWEQCKELLKSAKFVKDSEEKPVPTLKNLIKSIEGFQSIWKILNEKYNVNCMLTRNFNQDPIENFFGNIRSIGFRNVSPNCLGFEGAFKTLLLNNYSSTHSINANCEEDFNNCLQAYTFFLSKETNKQTNVPSEPENIVLEIPIESIISQNNDSDGTHQRNYVTGWILSKCLEKVKSCKHCKNCLCGDAMSRNNDFIRLKEFNKNKQWLCYPSDELVNCFLDIQSLVTNILKSGDLTKVKHKSLYFIDIFVNFNFIKCETHCHIIKNLVSETAIKILICSWCRSVNRILSGQLIYNDNDEDVIKTAAQVYNKKYKHYK